MADPRNTYRCYFYNIDLQGRLFLEQTLPKNIATSIKDIRFQDFFFRRIRDVSDSERLWMDECGIPSEDYPYVSPCGKELNFIRPAATPFVFHTLLLVDRGPTITTTEIEGGGMANTDVLLYGGTLQQDFRTEWLALSRSTGRLFHRMQYPRHDDDSLIRYGLIRSSVAVLLSERIVACYGDASLMGIDVGDGTVQPIAWLPENHEPGVWAMPAHYEEG